MIKYIITILGLGKEKNNLISNLKKYEEKKAELKKSEISTCG
tara:strand:+ start:344 stop:469 length:126 start_codon:yes stop_codon:yes gene_type:complete